MIQQVFQNMKHVFSRSKAEQEEVRTTVTISTRVPIIPCDQAATENQLTKTFQMFQKVLKLTYGSILVSPRREMRKEKR